MALCLLRSRLSAGRSFAAGVAKAAVSGGTSATKPVRYLGNVRRFSADAGNTDNNSGNFMIRLLIVAGCGLAFGQCVRSYVDKRVVATLLEGKSSTLSEETKAELLRYVDGKFSEAQGLTKSSQEEDRAGVVQSRQYVDRALSRLEHDLRAETRAELARIRKQYDDSTDRNSQVIAQRRATDEKKLSELTSKIAQVHGEVQSCERKLNSALVQQNSRVVADEGNRAELRSQFDKLLLEFQKTDRKLSTALSQVSSDEKKLAELTKEIKQIQGEVRSCDRKLDSALVQRNSRSANEGDYAELSGEVAELRREFQKTDRKLKTALSQVSSWTATEGTSADFRNEIARLSQEIRNTDRKLDAALSRLNSRAASEGSFAECSNEIARMRQKVSRLEGTVDRLVEESRKKPPSDPGVGPSGPKAKKYKQD